MSEPSARSVGDLVLRLGVGLVLLAIGMTVLVEVLARVWVWLVVLAVVGLPALALVTWWRWRPERW